MAKAPRPEANPYAPSGAVLRSDMPEGFVPPDDVPPETRPRQRWSRFVLWTLRVAACLYLALSGASLFYALTTTDRPQGAADERRLLGQPTFDAPGPSESYRKYLALQLVFQRATTALILGGLSEGIALLLAKPRA